MAADPVIAKALPALLRLAGSHPWREITLAMIADEAGLSLGDFHGHASREDLLEGLDGFFDAAMSEDGPSAEDTPRERLFDVLMKRFEAMEPFREALCRLIQAREAFPAYLPSRAKARYQTASWALASAGLDNDAPAPFAVKCLALSILLADVQRAWQLDTAGDLAKTMAALDQGLRRIEERVGQVSRFTVSGLFRRRDSSDRGWGRREAEER